MKQSRLERIVSKTKIAIYAGLLSLIPTTKTGNSDIPPAQKEIIAENIWELGRANELFKNFEEAYQIPGIRNVYKFENKEANYLLIYFRMGYHPKKRMSRSYRKRLIAINNDAYKAYSFLQEKYGIEDLYRETLTYETWMDYNRSIDSTTFAIGLKEIFDEMKKDKAYHLMPPKEEMRRFNERYKEQVTRLAYDAAFRLAVEKNVIVFPAEDPEIFRRAGEKLKIPWVDMKTHNEANNLLFRERELYSLQEGVLLGEVIVALFFGGMHADGFEESSLIKSIKEHNADPENKYDQYCAVILTPDHYPTD